MGHQPEGGMEAAEPVRCSMKEAGVTAAPGIGDLSSLPAWVWQDFPVADWASRARCAQVGLEEGS